MTISDETVMAYVDGELDDTARAAIDAAVASDPELARRVARHRALRERLHQELDPVLHEPVPERLLAAVHGTAPQRREGNVVPLRPVPLARWSWPQWGAMAASLIIGVLLATLLWRQPSVAPLSFRAGQMLASGALDRALSKQLASNQAADAPVRIGVSFVSREGSYCRTFVLRDRRALAGIACREHDRWLLTALANSPPSDTPGEYRPAASSLPPSIARTVDDLIVGEPLDTGAELNARAKGWQR
jgi:negative regulator of sigma E activity